MAFKAGNRPLYSTHLDLGRITFYDCMPHATCILLTPELTPDRRRIELLHLCAVWSHTQICIALYKDGYLASQRLKEAIFDLTAMV